MNVRKWSERLIFGSAKRTDKADILRNMSLRSKLICFFLFLIILPTLIYFMIFNTYSNNTKNKEMQLINQLSSQAVQSINSYMDDLYGITKQPLYDSSLMKELKTIFQKTKGKIRSDSDKETWTAILSSVDALSISNKLNSIRGYKQNTNAVFLFDMSGNTISYSLTYGQLDGEYRPNEENWFRETLLLNGTACVSGDQPGFKALPQLYNQKKSFTVSRAIKDYNGVDILGVIGVFIDMDVLTGICSDIEYVDGESIFIVNEVNQVVYDIAENSIGKSVFTIFPEWDTIETIPTGQGVKGFEKEGKQYLFFSNFIGKANWRLIRIIPQDSLYRDERMIQYNLIMLILLLTMIAGIASYFVSISLTSPLKKLLLTMNAVGKGNMSIRFNAKYNDEIGKLGKGFNNMIDEIEKLIKDVYITNMRKKEADLTVLQAQINPHFIYNTLETIRMIARINNNMPVYNMLFILGKLLRYSINIKNQIVTVTDEIDHLKNYIFLQNNRFDNQYELQLNIPEPMADIPILKLIFQPVVENAISHGLTALSGKKIIEVSGEETPEGIYFSIKDNGTGISEEQLVKITESMNDFTLDSTKSIGLKNVNERIKLYYGEKYGITISSEREKGTVVTFTFPERSVMDQINKTGNGQEESTDAKNPNH